MNRVWRAVVATVLTLVVGGSVPSGGLAASTLGAAARHAAAWLAGPDRAPLALVGCLTLWLLVRLARPATARVPPRPRPRPSRPPTRPAPLPEPPVSPSGHSVAVLARETGLAQDALRLLDASGRRAAFLQGRNCRSGRIGRAQTAGPGAASRDQLVAAAAVGRPRRAPLGAAHRLPT